MALNPAIPERITHLASGGVITNYHCVSHCGHCLYNSGPHREKAYLAPEQAMKVFERIKALGCRAGSSQFSVHRRGPGSLWAVVITGWAE